LGKLIKKHRWSFILVLSMMLGIILYQSLFAPSAETSNIVRVSPEVQPQSFVPLYWIAGIVGGCIALTLSYVSWRTYRGQHKKRKKS